MSDRPKKNRSLGRNSSALIQLALAAVAIFLLTLSLQSLAPRYDLTERKTFSLSEATTNLLESDLLSEREVAITCLADRSSPYHARVMAILQEYERLSGMRIMVRAIDPLTSPSEAFKFTERLALRPTEDIVVIEERNAQAPAVIGFSDLMVFEVTHQNQRRLSAYQIEDHVSTKLLSLLEEKRRVVYLVSDHSDHQNLSEDGIGATLQALYRNQNIDIRPLSLAQVPAVPDDASGLLLLTPQYDLEPAEMQKLVSYWGRPKASILAVLDPTKRPKRLRAFFRMHGITLRDDRLYTLSDHTLATKTVANFTQGSELTASLAGQSTLFDGVSGSLEVRELAEELINQRIAPIGLVEASALHYSESRYAEAPATYDENEDHRHGLYLAAGVIKGNEMSDSTASSSSRMIVLSTADFLQPNTIRDEQIDFVKSSINWLVGRAELIGIGPKPLQRYKLNLVAAEISQVNRLTLIFIPLGFLLIGTFVWTLRRP